MLGYARSRVRQFLTDWCAVLARTDTATAGSGRKALWAQASPKSTAVHAAVTDTGSLQTISTGLTQPNEPSVLTATAGGTLANVTAISLTVTGKDASGATIAETLPAFGLPAAAGGQVATVIGTKAFASITSYVQPACGSGVTISLGLATPASREPVRYRGLEALAAGRLMATESMQAILPYDAVVTAPSRLLFVDGLYEVRGVSNPRARHEATAVDVELVA